MYQQHTARSHRWLFCVEQVHIFMGGTLGKYCPECILSIWTTGHRGHGRPRGLIWVIKMLEYWLQLTSVLSFCRNVFEKCLATDNNLNVVENSSWDYGKLAKRPICQILDSFSWKSINCLLNIKIQEKIRLDFLCKWLHCSLSYMCILPVLHTKVGPSVA